MNAQKKDNRTDIVGLTLTIIDQKHNISCKTGYTKSISVFEHTTEAGIERMEKESGLILESTLPVK